jgi:hypothetical protein
MHAVFRGKSMISRREIIWIGGPLIFGLPMAVTGFLNRWSRYHSGDWSSAPNLSAFSLATDLLLGYFVGALFAWAVLSGIDRLRK